MHKKHDVFIGRTDGGMDGLAYGQAGSILYVSSPITSLNPRPFILVKKLL